MRSHACEHRRRPSTAWDRGDGLKTVALLARRRRRRSTAVDGVSLNAAAAVWTQRRRTTSAGRRLELKRHGRIERSIFSGKRIDSKRKSECTTVVQRCCSTMFNALRITASVARQCLQLHCCKGDQLFLWRIAKLGVLELRNSWTICHQIWRGWLRWRNDPVCQNSNRSPQWGRPGKWVKYHSRVVFSFFKFSFFVTTIFARVPRLNRRTDFYAVWFIGCQSRVIDFLEG